MKTIRYQHYSGERKFRVSHPKHGTVEAKAPDRNSAMVAAAGHWGVRWQAYDFYAFATVAEL